MVAELLDDALHGDIASEHQQDVPVNLHGRVAQRLPDFAESLAQMPNLASLSTQLAVACPHEHRELVEVSVAGRRRCPQHAIRAQKRIPHGLQIVCRAAGQNMGHQYLQNCAKHVLIAAQILDMHIIQRYSQRRSIHQVEQGAARSSAPGPPLGT